MSILASSSSSSNLDITQLIDCVPYADGELSNVDRRRVQLLIEEEMNKNEQQQRHQNNRNDHDTNNVFKDAILQNTYDQFVKNNCKFPALPNTKNSMDPMKLQSKLQNDKNQKINMSLLESNARSYWTAYLKQMEQNVTKINNEKAKINAELQRVQLKRKREQVEFSMKESALRAEWWSLVRSSNRVMQGVMDLESACAKYRRILDEREEISKSIEE